MNRVVKIKKRTNRGDLDTAATGVDAKTPGQRTREIVSTVQGWIAELQERRRIEERTSLALRRI